jgi:subtilase family serine protease
MGQFARTGLLRRAAVFAAVGLVAVTLGPAAASATNPPIRTLLRLSGMQPAPLSRSGARLERPADDAWGMHLQVYFSSPDPSGLQAAARAIANPSSPTYRHYLSVRQFRALYAPSTATTQAVNSYLTSQGVKVGPLDPNGMSEPVSGTVRQFNAALHTTLQQVRTADGSQVVGSTEAPGVPANLASSITYIDGLTPWVQLHDDLSQARSHVAVSPSSAGESRASIQGQVRESSTASVSECSSLSGRNSSQQIQGMDPNALASAYKLSGFYASSDTGQNETIALIEYDSFDLSAVQAWDACLNVSPTVASEVDPSYPPLTTPQTLEATADIETLIGIAPSASIEVYETQNGGPDLDPWKNAITGLGLPSPPAVISSSWGLCEPQASSGLFAAETSLFSEALSQGQTIFVASGDSGSEACDPTATSSAQADEIAVNDPASNPLVTSVGGTASDKVTGPQYVWNSNTASTSSCLGNCILGASGGGLSTVWDQTNYQDGNPALQNGCRSGGAYEAPVSGTGSSGCREVPDVSAFAGNPYWEMCTDSPGGPCDLGGTPSKQYFIAVGGTSLAAPSWAGTVAMADEQCGNDVGFLNYALYDDTSAGHLLVGTVTSGGNDFTGTNSGKYGAYPTGSQNLATGLGYLGGVNLSAGALCSPSAPASVSTNPGDGFVGGF